MDTTQQNSNGQGQTKQSSAGGVGASRRMVMNEFSCGVDASPPLPSMQLIQNPRQQSSSRPTLMQMNGRKVLGPPEGKSFSFLPYVFHH